MKIRAALFALLVLVVSGTSTAQFRPPRRPPPRPFRPPPRAPIVEQKPASRPATTAHGALGDRLATEVSQALLRSDDENDHLRAIERLGDAGTTRALELIVTWIEPSGRQRSMRERLVAVRALARYADRPDVRRALVRLMSAAGAGSERTDALALEVRETAALALAASGTPAALDVLGKALRQQGALADAAALAFEAHPPRDISPVLAARGTPTVALAHVFGQLSDQRALEALRDFVKHAAPEVRAEAAIALTRLGDLETVLLARYWLAHERDPHLVLAAARILSLVHDPGSAPAIARLLEDPATRPQALDLALEAPNEQLVSLLGRLVDTIDAAELPKVFGAIGRAGGRASARFLVTQLDRPERAASAAYALALSPGDEASDELARALDVPRRRGPAARAAVVRAVALGDTVRGTKRALEALFASSEAANRAVGAWGLAALDAKRAAELISKRDPIVVRAAAKAVIGSPRAAQVAARRLRTERNPETRAQLSLAIVEPEGAATLATRDLLSLVESSGVEAPLAAYALARRDDPELRPRIEALLGSGDATVRAHTALGLGYGSDPSAIGLLERAYRFETEAAVRRAVAVALSHRPEAARFRLLAQMAWLEPDVEAREAARLALSGVRLNELVRGTGTLFIELVPNVRGAAAPTRAVLVTVPGGLALPALTDPDGSLSLVRLPRGPVAVRLVPL